MKELVYLLACAVNGTTPDSGRCASLDLEKLYRQAKFHTVRAAVCTALERAGISDSAFTEAKNKAVRKVVYFDIERGKILAEFEKQGIWYMPLKGSVLKSLYPATGMREMSDNDILFDKTKQKAVRAIMEEKGYKTESIGHGNHDVYQKPPVLNFELHTGLFGEYHDEKLYRYYRDPMRLMVKDDNSNYGYHFGDNDFYVFITAHEYKHFSGGGTGIRSLLDCYVYLKAKGDALDFGYIEQECGKLGIADFEKQRRELAMKIFADGDVSALDEKERELLRYYLYSGTYGTKEQSIRNRIGKQRHTTGKQAKREYILKRVFPDLKTMTLACPFVKNNPMLYPAGFIVRLVRGSTIKRKKLKLEYECLEKYDDK